MKVSVSVARTCRSCALVVFARLNAHVVCDGKFIAAEHFRPRETVHFHAFLAAHFHTFAQRSTRVNGPFQTNRREKRAQK